MHCADSQGISVSRNVLVTVRPITLSVQFPPSKITGKEEKSNPLCPRFVLEPEGKEKNVQPSFLWNFLFLVLLTKRIASKTRTEHLSYRPFSITFSPYAISFLRKKKNPLLFLWFRRKPRSSFPWFSMFLQSYQQSNDPLMAEIVSRNFENPILGFPLLQEHQSFPSIISTFPNPGVIPIVENTVIDTISSGGSAAKNERGRDDFRSCFDREISVKVHKQCLELDRFVALHTEKVRAELEARRRSCWRQVAAAVEAGVQRMLSGKDEEIDSISRQNSALEERMRALLVEGQLWRSLAQANEATVVSLRRELELLWLSPANDVGPSLEEGQGDNGDVYCETTASSAGDREEKEDGEPSSSCCHRRGCNLQKEKEEGRSGGGGECWCKGCGSKEVSVLLLPCRHLCLCAACEPASEACPLCFCPKSAILQVYVT